MRLIQGDALDVLPTLADASVDMVLADPPYGTTACKWDSIIPLKPLWTELKRVTRQGAAVVMMGSQPFTSILVESARDWFRHAWVWEKTRPSGFIGCNKAPLKSHEDICVFASVPPSYFPQKEKAAMRQECPQRIKAHPAVCQSDRQRTFDNGGEAYPRSILKIANPNHNNVHPTQKPVPLMAYLVRTYTRDGEVVLDFCMGSGTTGVACLQTNRNFIGIEKDPTYFTIAQKRLADAQSAGPLFANLTADN